MRLIRGRIASRHMDYQTANGGLLKFIIKEQQWVVIRTLHPSKRRLKLAQALTGLGWDLHCLDTDLFKYLKYRSKL